jgi:hypothetical protein
MRKLQLKIIFMFVCALFLLSAGTHIIFAAQAKDKTSSSKAASDKKSGAPVDLNSASEKELDDLPGVGPATAKKIIAGRPYSSVDGLSKAGVSAATIKKITPLVTVSGAKAAEAAPEPPKKSSTKSAKSESTKKSTEASAKDEAPAAQPAPAPAKSAEPAPTPPAKSASAKTSTAPPGPGTVWVNTESGVYHYSNSQYYGKTKQGKYMSEADADKAGYHAAKNEKKPQ